MYQIRLRQSDLLPEVLRVNIVPKTRALRDDKKGAPFRHDVASHRLRKARSGDDMVTGARWRLPCAIFQG